MIIYQNKVDEIKEENKIIDILIILFSEKYSFSIKSFIYRY
jgi:hypothetical protein